MFLGCDLWPFWRVYDTECCAEQYLPSKLPHVGCSNQSFQLRKPRVHQFNGFGFTQSLGSPDGHMLGTLVDHGWSLYDVRMSYSNALCRLCDLGQVILWTTVLPDVMNNRNGEEWITRGFRKIFLRGHCDYTTRRCSMQQSQTGCESPPAPTTTATMTPVGTSTAQRRQEHTKKNKPGWYFQTCSLFSIVLQ